MPKYSSNKKRRLQQKIRKLKTQGLGCPWGNDGTIYRIELCWENKLEEQSNHQLHWFSIRNLKSKELAKYLDFFRTTGDSLGNNETVELRHALCYLDSFYQQNRSELKCNRAFIFPADRIGDNKIRYPIALRLWNKEFEDFPLTKDLLGVYRNLVYHKQELKNKKFKTLTLIH